MHFISSVSLRNQNYASSSAGNSISSNSENDLRENLASAMEHALPGPTDATPFPRTAKRSELGNQPIDVGVPDDTSVRDVLDKLIAAGSVVLNSSPDDTVTTVISCGTSKGNLTIDLRRGWGPVGAQRYLSLVQSTVFDDLPFFRVCPRYITQFGVKYRHKDSPRVACAGITDDPSLWGARDMDFGYLLYAGSGANGRGCQVVVA